MTGVPGGDVTLHAAITDTLDLHRPCTCGCGECEGEGEDSLQWTATHAADRVLAVLADRLPHTPAGDPAAVDRMVGQRVHVERHAITHYEGVLERAGGDLGLGSSGVHAITQDDGLWRRVRSAGPVVFGDDSETQYDVITPLPDSPPAAPEPRQGTCYFTPRVLAPPCPRHPAAPEPRQDT